MDVEVFTDDEDFNELINHVLHPREIRQFRHRKDHFNEWSEKEFLQRFRLSKHTVRMLIEELTPTLQSSTNRNHAVSPTEKVLATLRFLATGSILQVIGDFVGIDKGTASRVIHQCLVSISQLRPHFIRMPTNQQEINSVRQGFYNIARFPRCVGALDCTHVKIQSPGGADAEIYRNRKGYFSFNIQAVCDSNLVFRDIVARWQGSAADATIFRNSNLRRNLEYRLFGEDSLLVGDSGYPIKNYLMTPLQQPLTPAEHLYNEAQVRTRNPIERCFGVWKRRFPILALGIRLNIEKVEEVVIASAILHNIARNMNDEVPEADEDVEAAIRMGDIDEIAEQQRIPVAEITRFVLINGYFENLLHNV